MTVRSREIARVVDTLENDPKFGGTRDEILTVTEYPDAGVVIVEVEHYDGARSIQLGPEAWASFRSAIAAEHDREGG